MPKTRTKLGCVPRYEKDPRWPKFCELLLETHNAERSALAAGYAPSTAHSRSSEMAAVAFRGIRDELFLAGFTKSRLARELIDCLDAQLHDWNPAQKCWDYFKDHKTRITLGYDRIKAVVEPEPPKPLVQQFVGINFSEPLSKEEFIERYRERWKEV